MSCSICAGLDGEEALDDQLATQTERADRLEKELANRPCADGECLICDYCTDAVAWNDELKKANGRTAKAEKALAQSQADAASMRRAHEEIARVKYGPELYDSDHELTDYWFKRAIGYQKLAREALATDSGRALLEELAAVKKERDGLRERLEFYDEAFPFFASVADEALAASTPGEEGK